MTPDQTTFQRLQTDSPDAVTVFLSLDGTLADGSTITGPWDAFTVPLTEAEIATAAGIIDRAREQFAARINAAQVTP
jgi:hypothetical protein